MANIKDNLIRMKSTSEIMVDLAYSAVFLRDRKLAEQVIVKDREMKKLEDETLMLLFKVKIPEEERLPLIDLMGSIMEISHAATKISEIAVVEKHPSILKDILKDHKLRSV